ncbi:O-antigen ligase family protein [Caulobacter vibrioides]|nr:O-antigen ligase family protein [Caulobacter vibrioides]
MGKMIAVHSVGRSLWFFGVNDRLSAIFGTSIHYGSAIMLTIPIVFKFMSEARGTRKIAFALLLALSLYLLVYAQARTALLLTTALLIALPAAYSLANARALTPATTFMIALAGFVTFMIIGVFYADRINALFDEYFIQARASSARERFDVYRLSFADIIERPLIGYGTQKTVDNLSIPLGSHSWYLAAIYKHGLFGFIPFLGVIISLNSAAVRNIFQSRNIRDQKTCVMLSGTLLTHALLSTSLEPVVGAIHLFIFGSIAGCALAYHAILTTERSVQSQRPR